MQKEFQPNFGVPVIDIRADDELYRIESYNPKYREIIVKEGLNPIAPANSEIIMRTVDPISGSIQVVYGIYAERAFMPMKAEPPPKKTTELTAEAKVLRESDTLKQNDVVNLVKSNLEYAEPVTGLDSLRTEAKKNASVITEFPNLMGQKMEGFSEADIDWRMVIGVIMSLISLIIIIYVLNNPQEMEALRKIRMVMV